MTPERMAELRELARSSLHKFWANFGDGLNETLDALEADEWRVKAGHYEMERDAMGIKAHTLRVALLRYGQHASNCQRITRTCCLNHEWPCTCGLDAALGHQAEANP